MPLAIPVKEYNNNDAHEFMKHLKNTNKNNNNRYCQLMPEEE